MMELEGRLTPPRAFQEFLETQELQAELTGARFLEETQASCAGMLGILLARIGTGMERPHDRNQVPARDGCCVGVCSGTSHASLSRRGAPTQPVEWCFMKPRPSQPSATGGRVRQVMGVLTLFVLRASLGGGSCGVERKLTKVFLDVHLKVPPLTFA